MRPFTARRLRGLSGLGLALGVGWAIYTALDVSLLGTSFASGWGLLALCVGLALFGARKRLPFLPLGSASSWMQLHAYAGLLAVALYLAHTGLRWPTGRFETLLACAFYAVAATGGAGLLLSRLLPMRLATRSEALIFERIPAMRRAVREEVESLVLRATREVPTSTLGPLYAEHLADWFDGPQGALHHLVGSRRPLHRLELQLDAVDRYLGPGEREILADVRACVRQKSELDYQWTLQWVLKHWLFLHVPLTAILFALVIVHAALALAFHGGLR